MTKTDIIQSGLRSLKLQVESLNNLQSFVNEQFAMAVELIHASKGRLVVSGIGKSAIIAQKIVGTLNSTGTPGLFMHAADAIHGDLGMIQPDDVVLLISKSGESAEMKVLAPLVRNFGNKLIGMVGNENSYLAKFADVFLNTTVAQEACPNNLAPTTSTTAQMVMGDALAICLMELNGFTGQDFAKFHPGGLLGKKLYLRVSDLYVQNERPAVAADSSLKDVILSISGGRLGITVVTDADQRPLGVVTDGDLRRMLEKSFDPAAVIAKDIMTQNPKLIGPDEMALHALEILKQHDITQLVVIKDGIYVGVIHLHDLIREGLL